MPPPGGWRDDVGDLPGLNPDFRLRFEYYREAVWRRTGIALSIRDGFRSTELQIQRRIENCGGNTYYNIWLKPSSSCNPATARPGTSKHEQGLAIDQAPSYTAHGYIREAANLAGLEFDVSSEAWHIVPKWSNGKPVPALSELPRFFGFTLSGQDQPPPAPPPEDEMRTDMVTRPSDGVQFQAIIRKDGRFEYRFTDPKNAPLITNNDWVTFTGAGAPAIPFAFDTVNCFIFDERFHVEVRNMDTGQAGTLGQQGYGFPFKFYPTLFGSK